MTTANHVSGSNTKSTGTAYLLWFFLGGFGAHRFYCGKKGSGIGMLCLTLGSILTSPFVIGLLGFPAVAVWWIVDAFLISKWINEPQPSSSPASHPAGTVGAIGGTNGESSSQAA